MNRAISRVAAGLAVASFVTAGSMAIASSSQARDFDDHRDHPPIISRPLHGDHPGGWGWTGGYYRAPPVVYGGGYGYGGYGPYGYAYPPFLGFGFNAGGVHVGVGL